MKINSAIAIAAATGLVAIIGVIAAPMYLSARDAAARQRARTTLEEIQTAVTDHETREAHGDQQSPIFNKDDAPTLVFSVPEMMCEHSCVPQVKKILAAQPGVKDVLVELRTKTATVAIDATAFNANSAIAALVDMQFKGAKLANRR